MDRSWGQHSEELSPGLYQTPYFLSLSCALLEETQSEVSEELESAVSSVPPLAALGTRATI